MHADKENSRLGRVLVLMSVAFSVSFGFHAAHFLHKVHNVACRTKRKRRKRQERNRGKGDKRERGTEEGGEGEGEAKEEG